MVHPGRVIRLLRTVDCVSIAAFAERIGVGRSYLSQCEHGAVGVGLGMLERAAKELGVPLSLLFCDGAEQRQRLAVALVDRLHWEEAKAAQARKEK
jgi:transcriptional regulator with XRE-family HTH domain